MQLDMHYYGTYSMARAAGIKPKHAQVIATAAQYVDDSDTALIELQDGAFLGCAATAHHPVDTRNIEANDQRQVWIPFHFLPGNEGNTFEERLVCRMDSALANKAVDHALEHADKPYGLSLLGVVAHMYADTFSHYGFSGITSDINGVDTNSITPKISSFEVLKYIKAKADDFFEKRKADAAELIKLGHGGVATYPDRPYLRWSFSYLDSRSSGERDNPATFLLACEKLHGLFCRFGRAAPAYINPDETLSFSRIRNAVVDVLACEGKMEKRIEAWQEAAAQGKLFRNAEEIPDYRENAFTEDLTLLPNCTSSEIKDKAIFQFMQAASVHREFVLRKLLPDHGLQILLP